MARIPLLPSTAITAAGTVTGSTFAEFGPEDQLQVETIFTYGSGGTTCKVYIQTSLDGGLTWIDIACHAFTTATASKVSAITENIAPASQAFAPTDGSLTDNTIIQGVLGDLLRAKVISVGTYAATTVKVVFSR